MTHNPNDRPAPWESIPPDWPPAAELPFIAQIVEDPWPEVSHQQSIEEARAHNAVVLARSKPKRSA